MAARVLRERSSVKQQIDHAFVLCLSRPPTKSERDRVQTYYNEMTRRLESSPDEAAKIAGDTDKLATERRTDLAVWTLICRAILNLDETITQG